MQDWVGVPGSMCSGLTIGGWGHEAGTLLFQVYALPSSLITIEIAI